MCSKVFTFAFMFVVFAFLHNHQIRAEEKPRDIEPDSLRFYTFNHAFAAHQQGESGAIVTVRNHSGKTVQGQFRYNGIRSWAGDYGEQGFIVPSPGELLSGPYTVTVKRGEKVLAMFRLRGGGCRLQGPKKFIFVPALYLEMRSDGRPAIYHNEQGIEYLPIGR